MPGRSLRGIVLAIVFSLLLAGLASAADPVHWTYEGAAGPAHWGELSPDFAACAAGLEQSPVDIPASAAVNPPDLALSYRPSALNILNNGHTVQVNYDPGSTLQVQGTTYQLAQFHFHSASEHTVAGQQYPLELHLVHRSGDGRLAVVGVLIKAGAENPAFAPVFTHLPASESEAQTVAGATVDASQLLPAERSYYRYNGSLTTPPCTEGVRWLVMRTPVELSQAQISAYQNILANTFRPVQPINKRTFLLTSALPPDTLPVTGWPLPPAAYLAAIGLLPLSAGLYLRRRKE